MVRRNWRTIGLWAGLVAVMVGVCFLAPGRSGAANPGTAQLVSVLEDGNRLYFQRGNRVYIYLADPGTVLSKKPQAELKGIVDTTQVGRTRLDIQWPTPPH